MGTLRQHRDFYSSFLIKRCVSIQATLFASGFGINREIISVAYSVTHNLLQFNSLKLAKVPYSSYQVSDCGVAIAPSCRGRETVQTRRARPSCSTFECIIIHNTITMIKWHMTLNSSRSRFRLSKKISMTSGRTNLLSLKSRVYLNT